MISAEAVEMRIGDETILHLLCTCPTLGRSRKKQLGAYHMDYLDELSCIDIGSLSLLIENSEWFLD